MEKSTKSPLLKKSLEASFELWTEKKLLIKGGKEKKDYAWNVCVTLCTKISVDIEMTCFCSKIFITAMQKFEKLCPYCVFKWWKKSKKIRNT